MRTLSLDLRERILASYDHGEGTRDEVASRYRVSLGMVKKLLQQRRRTGQIGPRHQYSGRKPIIFDTHHRQWRALLGRKPDLTLRELRQAVALECSLPAIHYALAKLGLTYKKDAPRQRARSPRHRAGAARVAARPSGLRSRQTDLSGRVRRHDQPDPPARSRPAGAARSCPQSPRSLADHHAARGAATGRLDRLPGHRGHDRYGGVSRLCAPRLVSDAAAGRCRGLGQPLRAQESGHPRLDPSGGRDNPLSAGLLAGPQSDRKDVEQSQSRPAHR